MSVHRSLIVLLLICVKSPSCLVIVNPHFRIEGWKSYVGPELQSRERDERTGRVDLITTVVEEPPQTKTKTEGQEIKGLS